MSHPRLLLTGLALSVGCAVCGGHVAAAAAHPSNSPGTPAATATATVAVSSAPPATAPTSAPTLSAVPAVVTETKAAVAMTAASAFGHRVTARIVGHTAGTTVAHGPGQIAGAPSVSFTISIENGDDKPVPLDGVTVTASYGPSALPATLSDDSATFHGPLRAGATATGTYTFDIPVEERRAVTLTVSYLPSEPTVVFTGSVA